jgi:hypothetical protein
MSKPIAFLPDGPVISNMNRFEVALPPAKEISFTAVLRPEAASVLTKFLGKLGLPVVRDSIITAGTAALLDNVTYIQSSDARFCKLPKAT